MTTLNAFQKRAIKETAKEVSRLLDKQTKLNESIEQLTVERNAREQMINQYEERIRLMTGGYSSMDLCEKVNNNWVFKYPNILPYLDKTSHGEIPPDTESIDIVDNVQSDFDDVQEEVNPETNDEVMEEVERNEQAITYKPFEL